MTLDPANSMNGSVERDPAAGPRRLSARTTRFQIGLQFVVLAAMLVSLFAARMDHRRRVEQLRELAIQSQQLGRPRNR